MAASTRATRRRSRSTSCWAGCSAALEYVAPERLWLAPDCGLMTIPRDLARAKAALLVEAAHAARAAL